MTMKERTIAVQHLKKETGVILLVCDLDDTLTETQAVFSQQKFLFVRAILQLLTKIDVEIPETLFYAQFDEFELEAFKKLGVNPNKWSSIIQNFAHFCQKTYAPHIELPFLLQLFQQQFHLLENIYTTVPSFCPEAIETLCAFAQSGIKLAILTHAGEEYTRIKIDAINAYAREVCGYTGDLLSMDMIFRVDVTEKGKTPEHWERAAQSRGATPSQSIAAGDSIRSDIYPALGAGYCRVYFVDRPNNTVVNHDACIIPKNVYKISTFADILCT